MPVKLMRALLRCGCVEVCPCVCLFNCACACMCVMGWGACVPIFMMIGGFHDDQWSGRDRAPKSHCHPKPTVRACVHAVTGTWVA